MSRAIVALPTLSSRAAARWLSTPAAISGCTPFAVHRPRPADVLALPLGAVHAGADALGDEGLLELRETRE